MEEKQKLTVDRIIIFEEPIPERHNLDAFLIFKRKKIIPRRNYRALVYVREKIPNRSHFVLTYVPGFFNLNPGDQITKARLTDLETKHREKVTQWVITNNSRYIITEPQCNCNSENLKVSAFTLGASNHTPTVIKNPDSLPDIKKLESAPKLETVSSKSEINVES